MAHTASEGTGQTPAVQEWIWRFFLNCELPIRAAYLHDLPGDTTAKRRYIK